MNPQDYITQYAAVLEDVDSKASPVDGGTRQTALAPERFYAEQTPQGLETVSRQELLRLLRSDALHGSAAWKTVADVEQAYRDRWQEDSKLRAELDALRTDNETLRQEISLIYRSTSWRVTAPGRLVVSSIRRLLRRGRR